MNGPPQRPVLPACDLCGAGPKMKSTDQNQEHLNWNNRFEILSVSLSSRLQKWYKMLRTVLKSDTKW